MKALFVGSVTFAVALEMGIGAVYAIQQPRAPDNSALASTLTALERSSWDAWQRRDGAYFGAFLSDDHVEIGIAGPAGKAIVVAGVNSPGCVVKSYALDTFALTVFNADTALLTYHAQQDTTCGGVAVPSPAWTSSLYLQRGGRWENALYQQTKATK